MTSVVNAIMARVVMTVMLTRTTVCCWSRTLMRAFACTLPPRLPADHARVIPVLLPAAIPIAARLLMGYPHGVAPELALMALSSKTFLRQKDGT